VFLPPDRMIFLATDTLVARRIDLARGTLVGDPAVIAEDVARSSSYYGAYSASPTGVIVYASGASISDLAWVDRTGQLLGTVSASRQHVDFRLSPNGEALASAEVDGGSDGPDIYVLDLARGTRLRVTASRFTDATPVWAPDSQRLVFRSNRQRVHDLFVKDPFTNAPEQPFYASKEPKYPTSWSRAGDRIAFHTRSEETGWDVAVAPTTGVVRPRSVLISRFNERQAQFSPDDRWLAYTSDESNQDQVYVQSLDDRAKRVNISVSGGDEPRWRGDGAELFYVSSDGYLMAVAIRHEGGVIAPDRPRQLFHLRIGTAGSSYLSSYDVHPDGRRFIIRVPKGDARSLPLTVLVSGRISAGP
jgi:Tol biopolymer transport system component